MDLVDLFRQVMRFIFFLLEVLVGHLNKIIGRYLEPFKTLFQVAKLANLLKHSDHFKAGAFSVIIQCLKIKVFKVRDEPTVQEVLNLLIKLFETEQRFFKEQLVKVIGNMLPIAETDELKAETRRLVVKFVMMLVEVGKQEPEMMTDLPELYISRLFEILMGWLSHVQWNSAEIEVEDAGQSNYSYGKDCLRRLVTTLGGNTIFDIVRPQLCLYFNSEAQKWNKHFAALVALTEIAKGRSTASVDELKDMMIRVVVSDSLSPYVGRAAINAIGELSANLGEAINDPKLASTRLTAIRFTVELSAHIEAPGLQDAYQRRVLPALSEAIKKDPNQRVKLAAIKATFQLSAHLIAAPDLQAEYQRLVLPALSEVICDFKYPQFQAAYVMVYVCRNYPLLSPCETVGTLLEEHVSSRRESELQLQVGDFAWHQLRAIKVLVKLFQAELQHDTWTATFNSLSPGQQAELLSILEGRI